MKVSSMLKPCCVHFKCMYISNVFQYYESLFSAHSFEFREWTHMNKCAVVASSVCWGSAISAHINCLWFLPLHFQACIYITKWSNLNCEKLESPPSPLPKYGWTEAHSCVQRSLKLTFSLIFFFIEPFVFRYWKLNLNKLFSKNSLVRKNSDFNFFLTLRCP